jgi:hypothetical protein
MQKARYCMQRTPWHLAITPLTVWLLLLWAGCAGVRPARLPAELLAQRQEHDAQRAEKGRLRRWRPQRLVAGARAARHARI